MQSSQVLVYSKTSLQTGAISAATPRALYFDTDTYVGYVQGTRNLELGTMDSEAGAGVLHLAEHARAARADAAPDLNLPGLSRHL